MPLLDHFRPPLAPQRMWESFHSAWAVKIMETLNRSILPRKGYFSEAQVHVGGRVELDVGSFESEDLLEEGNGGVALELWAPPKAAIRVPAVFPDEIEIQVFSDRSGATLVGAIELVSPGNKDRPETRRAFAHKCASYLQAGVGLVVVDVVTERLANLHDELAERLDWPDDTHFNAEMSLYVVSYRPSKREPGGDQIEAWPVPLTLGEALPVVPLPLRGGPTLPLDLEATYTETRLGSRL